MATIKDPSKDEKELAIKWLRGEVMLKDVAKKLDCVGSSPGIYIRLCRAIKAAYTDGGLVIK